MIVDSQIAMIMGGIFALGLLGIALEDITKINKAAVALGMSVLLWSILLLGYDGKALFTGSFLPSEETKNDVTELVLKHLGDVSSSLFFILVSMLLVNTMDRYGAFRELGHRLRTTNKRRLLWTMSFLAFFFSALLDNLAASIVLVAILRKLVPEREERLKYACMCILACNAGGAWSPIGDVTTLLLWNSGRLTAGHQVVSLFLPALINLLAPLVVCSYWLFRKGDKFRTSSVGLIGEVESIQLPRRMRLTVLIIGLLSLTLIPVYQMCLGIPAFFGAIIGLVILWVYTDRMRVHHGIEQTALEPLGMTRLLHEADLSTIFYFLGVLMSVGALVESGLLGHVATSLDKLTHFSASVHSNNALLAGISGMASSLVDNVALVAAMLGMYPVGYNEAMVVNGSFWTFLAYCAVTGGSLLIIGSGTGVTVMGLERISFGYYLRRFSVLALLGYVAGALVYLLLN